MNTPNKITLSRILLIPLVIFFYIATFIPYGKLISALIFALACFTDFLDGMIARKTNQVTDLGKFFDTIADKVLIMTGMILVIAFPVAGNQAVVKPLWFGIVCVVIMLAREFIISALRQIAASKGVVLAADKGGKVKALFQDITITLYMFYAFFVADIYPKGGDVAQGFKVANTVIGIILMLLLAVSTLLTITSGVGYLVRNKNAFSEEKFDNFVKNIDNKSEETVKAVDTVVEEKTVITVDENNDSDKQKNAKNKPKSTSTKKSTSKSNVKKKITTASKNTATKKNTANKKLSKQSK